LTDDIEGILNAVGERMKVVDETIRELRAQMLDIVATAAKAKERDDKTIRSFSSLRRTLATLTRQIETRTGDNVMPLPVVRKASDVH
jgi:hypothetical protein